MTHSNKLKFVVSKNRISFWNQEVWFTAHSAGVFLLSGKHKTRFNWLIKLWLFLNGGEDNSVLPEKHNYSEEGRDLMGRTTA